MLKTKQKKRLLVFILALMLFSIIASSIASADVFDSIKNYADRFFSAYKVVDVNGKKEFAAAYNTERKILDFALFFILFLSTTLIGLRKWFGKDAAKGPTTGIALSLAALLSLAIVTFTNVTLGLLFPFAKNILFLIMFLVIYSIIATKKMAGESKFWAFILAAAITFAAFNIEGFIEDGVSGRKFDPLEKSKEGVLFGYKGCYVKTTEVSKNVKGVLVDEECECTEGCETHKECAEKCKYEDWVKGRIQPMTVYRKAGEREEGEVEEEEGVEEVETNYCEKDEDCGCGLHWGTGEDCIVANKKFILPTEMGDCDDFCSGKGDLVCLSSKKCGFVKKVSDEGCTVTKRAATARIEGKQVDQFCECSEGCTTIEECAEKCGYSNWVKISSEKPFGVYRVKATEKKTEPTGTGEGVQKIKNILGKEPTADDYNAIFDYGNPKIFASAGITKQRTKSAWDRIANDRVKGPVLANEAQKYKDYLEKKKKYGG